MLWEVQRRSESPEAEPFVPALLVKYDAAAWGNENTLREILKAIHKVKSGLDDDIYDAIYLGQLDDNNLLMGLENDLPELSETVATEEVEDTESEEDDRGVRNMNPSQARIELIIDVFEETGQRALALCELRPLWVDQSDLAGVPQPGLPGSDAAGYYLVRAEKRRASGRKYVAGAAQCRGSAGTEGTRSTPARRHVQTCMADLFPGATGGQDVSDPVAAGHYRPTQRAPVAR